MSQGDFGRKGLSSMPATSSSRKRLDLPQERENLDFQAVFTDREGDEMRQGFLPSQMEDKWFIHFEEGWLRFHRSWTGVAIYALRLEQSPAGIRVTESWVNRNPEQYNVKDTEYDRKLVRYLIDTILLKRSAPFPTPPALEGAPEGLVRHHYVGR
jgi:hypothetical protein